MSPVHSVNYVSGCSPAPGLRPSLTLDARAGRSLPQVSVCASVGLDDTRGRMSDFDLPEAPSRLLPRTAEIRKRLPHVVIAMVGLGVVGYFAYHAIHGDRGLLAWKALDRDVTEARADLEVIRAEHVTLERRVNLLRIDSLDLDMLDEWSRRVLNYSARDEAVIFTKEDDAGLLLGEEQGPSAPERRAEGQP